MDAISVLIIDDNPQNRRLVKKMLEVHGFKIFEASNGLDGVASAIEHKPRIILLDINLPDIDGIEVANTLRNQGNCESCTIIALTAKVMQSDRDSCFSAGANDFLPKPVDEEHLISLIRVWLSQ